MVHAILASPTSSAMLAGLLDTKHRDEHVFTMGCLLAGLLMEHMGDNSESECGGWVDAIGAVGDAFQTHGWCESTHVASGTTQEVVAFR